MKIIALKTLLLFSIVVISSCNGNKYDEDKLEAPIENNNSNKKSGMEADTYTNDKDTTQNTSVGDSSKR